MVSTEQYFSTVFLPQYNTRFPHAPLSDAEKDTLFSLLSDVHIDSHTNMNWSHVIEDMNFDSISYNTLEFIRSIAPWSTVKAMLHLFPEKQIKQYLEVKLPATRASQAYEDAKELVFNNPAFHIVDEVTQSGLPSMNAQFAWVMRQYPTDVHSPYAEPHDLNEVIVNRLSVAGNVENSEQDILKEHHLLRTWKGSFPAGVSYGSLPESLWFRVLENASWTAVHRFLVSMPYEWVFFYLETLVGRSRFRIYRDVHTILEREDCEHYPEEWLKVFTQ